MTNIVNTVYLSAVGDAWGRITEFTPFANLPLRVPVPEPLYITDDTQMALAVVDGLRHYEAERVPLINAIAVQFMSWVHDPDNNRAPGDTCMKALRTLEHKQHDSNLTFDPFAGSIKDSKGCGANMRAPWLGLLPWESHDIAQLASDQAKITHGHPTGLEAATLTALGVHGLVTGRVDAGDLTAYLLDLSNPAGECHALLRRAVAVEPAAITSAQVDPCHALGQGWIAEETLVLASVIADLYKDDPKEGLHRGVRTGGDSDSIACVAGAFLGAGFEGDWLDVFNENIVFESRYEFELDRAVRFFESVPSH